MKIFGIGTDIVKVSRVKKTLQKKTIINRLFNKNEILKCNRTQKTNNCYAKRFAAKEAFAKALGTGISKGINFNEIIILNEKNGKPFIKLIANTKKIVEKKLKKKKYKISLSLTDEESYAVAFVTISL
tara:strand:- start:137 stop:520 length:384 start_codon:yes stop_codon:yes gene_type:complete